MAYSRDVSPLHTFFSYAARLDTFDPEVKLQEINEKRVQEGKKPFEKGTSEYKYELAKLVQLNKANKRTNLINTRRKYTLAADAVRGMQEGHEKGELFPSFSPEQLFYPQGFDPNDRIDKLEKVGSYQLRLKTLMTVLSGIFASLGYIQKSNELSTIITDYAAPDIVTTITPGLVAYREPYYRAPELKDKPLHYSTQAADRYALAIVVLEMLFGKFVDKWDKEDKKLAFEKHDPKIFYQLTPFPPTHMQEALLDCLRSHPLERPVSTEKIRWDFEHAWADVMSPEPYDYELESKGAELAADENPIIGLGTIYKGTASGGAPCVVLEYFPAAITEYVQERDTLSLCYQKKHVPQHLVTYYGANDARRQLITESMDGSIKQVYSNQKNSRRKLLSDVMKAKVLYDIARAVYYLHLPDEKLRGHKQGVVLHRDINSKNVMMKPGWEKHEEKFDSVIPLDMQPITAKLGPPCQAGSISKAGKTAGDYKINRMYEPPEYRDGQPWTTASDVWQFGLFMFEVVCGISWHEGTQVDQCRITSHRLKPAAAGDLCNAYTQQWMASGVNAVPALVYELVQLGCWQTDPDKRPHMGLVVKVMEQLLEDALVAAKKLPPTKKFGVPKTDDNYSDKVFAFFGYKTPDPPPVPRRDTCVCPPPAHLR